MARKHETGHCEHCKKAFGYYLIHNGFNESSYAYCDSCGTTLLLDGWRTPKRVQMLLHQNISPEIEALLARAVQMRRDFQNRCQSEMSLLQGTAITNASCLIH
jgi:hypothetical protein